MNAMIDILLKDPKNSLLLMLTLLLSEITSLCGTYKGEGSAR